MKLSDFFDSAKVVQDGCFNILENSDSKFENALVYCDNPHYLKIAINNPNVSCLLIKKELYNTLENTQKGCAVVPNPRNEFYKLLNKLSSENLFKPIMKYGRGENCVIHSSAIVSKKTKIGNNVIIDENVIIKDNVEIGNNTHIHPGAILGCEGILYFLENGKLYPVKHAGGVSIGENVSILSGAIVVKSVHENILTKIGSNSLLGIRTTVGHDAQIGNHCILSGNCVIARKAVIDDNVWIGTSSVVREYVKVGKGVEIKVGSIVIRDVKEHQAVSGNFAINHKTHLKEFLKKKKD